MQRNRLTLQPRATAGAWLVAWLVAIGLAAVYVASTLQLSGDLRLFLPSPKTAEQRFLLEGIGEGPASRLLLVGLAGAPTEELVASSRALAGGLRDRTEFLRVDNGESDLGDLPERLLVYRYLLSAGLDDRRLDEATLERALRARLRDLASPAAAALEPLVPRDPTLEMLTLAESWVPLREPRRIDGVWFDSTEAQALLVIQTRAAGFDPDGQQAAIATLEEVFDTARSDPAIRMEVSGPGRFSALMKERTQAEATWLGSAATLGMLLLLGVAYRRARVLLLGALPLASAGLAGLACVSLLFGEVHGITLAFGFTLIGVAQDYPMHLFSHQHRGLAPLQNARQLWPTLATGVASTCVAYLAFIASGVTGLAQLAWFTISGLAVAGLSTRYLLPRIIGDDYRDPGASALLGRTWARLAGLPVPAWLPGALLVASAAALLLAPGPVWEDDLGALTPIPRPLVQRYAELRAELSTPDARYLIGVHGDSADDVLRALEQLTPGLEQQVSIGALEGFDHVARYLPSAATQQQRQARLPDPDALRAALDGALRDLPFRSRVFEPFLADVEQARNLPVLTPADLRDTPLELLVDNLLQERDGEWIGIVTLMGVRDTAALEGLLTRTPGRASLLDLKRASTALVVEQRRRILYTLGIAAVLLVVVVRLALGDWTRARRVIAPMVLTTAMVAGLLHLFGEPLNLFHLIALILAAGLGLDYALFFERAADDPLEQRRTLHGIIVCSLSTFMVFALLSASTIPVLQSIGVTVSLGVIANFMLALLMTRPGPGDGDGRA